MAEIQSQPGTRKSHRKTHNIKVDLTPMVDLGFLLITFFVITTSMREPKAAHLIMPKDSPIHTEVPGSSVITVLLLKDEKIVYYHGSIDTAKMYNVILKDFRQVIIEKKRSVAKKFGSADEMVLIIKSDEESLYKNFIDILDEVMINDIKKYFIADITPMEKERINKSE